MSRLSLGIDPSLTGYGWCVIDGDAPSPQLKIVASGHEGTLSSIVPVARFMHFRELVRDLLRRYEVGVVGIESPAYCAGPFSEQHFGLMMFSLEAVFERRKDCVLIDPTTLKYLVTGKSKADKSDMQRFVQIDTMSTRILDSNEADAYCIARETMRLFDLRHGLLSPESLTDTERSSFLTRIKKKKRTDGSLKIKRVAHVFRENSRFFEFSRVPLGDVALPMKSSINSDLLKWLESVD